ncbi:MAG: transcription factor FapR [Succiniclasticum sp.]|jgi:transcription factor fapR|nr:transcription factor FapR [Selenomonadales bacterium]MDY2869647.1 transcription factor FapR [Succiniclasticum sp.]MDY6303095.1 transcription factor FapR [Succiniclasticum sp.]MDY6345200.1 transcription factor FapR [Succiniclasticum sp.]
MSPSKKLIRQKRLQSLIRKNPFLTDSQLAERLHVSVPTVRLDRVCLNIPELRVRTRLMADEAQTRLRAIDKKDIVGELVDLELNKVGISTLTITNDMVLEKTGVGRGYFMFAMADTLALALVDTDFALTAVSNVKYKIPVHPGDRLVAKAEVMNMKEDRYYIKVIIRSEEAEVFRAKFIIVAVGQEKESREA